MYNMCFTLLVLFLTEVSDIKVSVFAAINQMLTRVCEGFMLSWRLDLRFSAKMQYFYGPASEKCEK